MVTKADEIEASVNEMIARRGQGSMMDGLTYPYAGNMRLHNHVRFFHPDGTYSDIPAPTYNPQKPTPYLERFLFHWTKKMKVTKDGEKVRWYFLTKQAEPPAQPIRCFIPNCTRAGGFSSNVHLYQHIIAKHGEESAMYADLLAEMKKQAQMDLDPAVLEQLGLKKSESAQEPAQEVYRCRVEGCGRFFDTEQGRKLHEKKGHK